MSLPAVSIDDAPLSGFHRRLTLFSCGGPFCDGYILGIIAIALGPLSREIGLNSVWEGMIAAASLVGMFVGGLLFGYITDLVGRRLMYTLDLLVFVLASLAQFWATEPLVLLTLRLILGIAIGADYPIVSALMTEFAPKRQRGMLLATMIGAWWLGYAASFIVGYALSFDGVSAWRWMLASSAAPALLVSVMRWGVPESPRWLLGKGRAVEAREVVRKHLGDSYHLDETPMLKTRYLRIFQGEYLGRTAFVCVFWACQIIPTFGIYTFAPALLSALGSTNPVLGTAITSLFFLAGVIPAGLLIDRVGRRPLLTVPFAVTGIVLISLAFLPKSSGSLITIAFVMFAAFNAGSSVLQWVYPSELFPTDVRATAIGFATAASRIGAACGTFLVPVALQSLGIHALMLIFGGICALGYVISRAYAPETRALSLTETSAAAKPDEA